MNRPTRTIAVAHLCMLGACSIWGLMSPMTKEVTATGLIGGPELVTFRVAGAAVCFWTASLFVRRERLARRRDYALFLAAALLCVVFNQCCYTIGIAYTSPVNASIMSTTMPIFTMVLAALVLREPVTWKKAAGVLLGAAGVVLLALASAPSAAGDRPTLGNLLCIAAQFSFALYLTLFKHLIQRYSVITTMKWMMTFAVAVILPCTWSRMAALPWADVDAATWGRTAFVVVGGTFVAYILSTTGQKTLRPTVVGVYNYVQPIVSCLFSVLVLGFAFGWSQAVAIPLVFVGVWLVTQSKSRRDLRKEQQGKMAAAKNKTPQEPKQPNHTI